MRNIETILAVATLGTVASLATPASAHTHRHHGPSAYVHVSHYGHRHHGYRQAAVVTPVAAPAPGLLASIFGGTPAPLPTLPTPAQARAGFAKAGHDAHRAILVATAPVRELAEAVGRVVGVGKASYYGGRNHTASGGYVGAATCAHRTLPFGTKVMVTNLSNHAQAILTVNDRGPFVHGRIVDVSVGAAGRLGMLKSGTANVRVEVVASR